MMRIVRLSLAVCLALFADVFASIKFLGVKSGYRYGDSWYPTWAENDTLYFHWTDGRTKVCVNSKEKS